MRHIIFDLDNTIYPKEIGLFTLVDKRINEYMKAKLYLDHNSIEHLRLKYMYEFGTTLGGLIAYYGIDPDEYLSFVHDIDLKGLLFHNPRLSKMMKNIILDKVIFTNGSKNHALRILDILGIKDYFSEIFDIEFMNYMAKPNPLSYQKVLNALKAKGEECLIVEDLSINLMPAKNMGMTTVLIGDEWTTGVDYLIKDIFGIEDVLNEIG